MLVTMIACPTCGNPVEEGFHYCKWCESRIDVRPRLTRSGIRTINLEDGNPTVDQARRRLHKELRQNANASVILRVIHGYGSSGSGGAIRVALVRTLNKLLRDNKIKKLLNGDGTSNAPKSDKIDPKI
jgi:hypothetical protein